MGYSDIVVKGIRESEMDPEYKWGARAARRERGEVTTLIGKERQFPTSASAREADNPRTPPLPPR